VRGFNTEMDANVLYSMEFTFVVVGIVIVIIAMLLIMLTIAMYLVSE
jgi:signal transduction histidine kinase